MCTRYSAALRGVYDQGTTAKGKSTAAPESVDDGLDEIGTTTPAQVTTVRPEDTDNDATSTSAGVSGAAQAGVIEIAELGRCPMCLMDPKDPRASSKCRHVACKECWDQWLAVRIECPVCRERCRASFLRHVKIVEAQGAT